MLNQYRHYRVNLYLTIKELLMLVKCKDLMSCKPYKGNKKNPKLDEYIRILDSLCYFVRFSSIFLKQHKHAATMNVKIDANENNFTIAFSLSAHPLNRDIPPSYTPSPCASHLPVTATHPHHRPFLALLLIRITGELGQALRFNKVDFFFW